MMDENTTDTHDLEYVDASRIAFMVTVDLDGNVDMQGIAPAEYVAATLRNLASQIEHTGWNEPPK
jgi:hypothetical protein